MKEFVFSTCKILISIPAHKALWDYHRQKKAGLDPVFDPEKLGIKNADFWVQERNASQSSAVTAEA